MSWAIWGDAVHRPQEELIHLGEDEMRVEFEFFAREDRYRVIRRHVRKKGTRQGSTSLELYINAINEGNFRPISGNTIRETEARIRDLVGMDYVTFINSAFILQGRADEFTTRSPTERKQVLGEILGLRLYDRLKERARLKVRESNESIQRIQGELDAWDQSVVLSADHESELSRVLIDLGLAAVDLRDSEGVVGVLRVKIDRLKGLDVELNTQESRNKGLNEEIDLLRERTVRQKRKIDTWALFESRQEQIFQEYDHLIELKKQDADLGKMLGPYNRLLERKIHFERAVASLPELHRRLDFTQKEMDRLESFWNNLANQRIELEGVNTSLANLESENKRLMDEMEGLKEKMNSLGIAGVNCPLCGTELGILGKQHIVVEYETQGKLYSGNYKENAFVIGELKPEQEKRKENILASQEQLTQTDRDLHSSIATLMKEIQSAEEYSNNITSLQEEFDKLGYDPLVHTKVQKNLKHMDNVEEEHRLLGEALKGLSQEREDLKRGLSLVDRRELELSEVRRRIESIGSEIGSFNELKTQLQVLEEKHHGIQEVYGAYQARKLYLDERIKEAKDFEAKRAERKKQFNILIQKREIYEQLEVAFSRSGIQAMLIEAAMPELEAEANRLLGQMTDNTMYLKLETQRSTLRGEIVETLEINVIDESTIVRGYATFSGGEAFRINLALRIALSRLLAHRSGAPLPTLFIDEGFGTQDAYGRERILDVIQSISHDFKCILVITHMEEIKEAFPVQIEVYRDANTSTFRVNA
jgi:exonuclease SbcC